MVHDRNGSETYLLFLCRKGAAEISESLVFNVELVCVSRSRVIGCICTVNQSIMDKHGLVTERACPIDRCISVIPGKRANSSEVK